MGTKRLPETLNPTCACGKAAPVSKVKYLRIFGNFLLEFTGTFLRLCTAQPSSYRGDAPAQAERLVLGEAETGTQWGHTSKSWKGPWLPVWVSQEFKYKNCTVLIFKE